MRPYALALVLGLCGAAACASRLARTDSAPGARTPAQPAGPASAPAPGAPPAAAAIFDISKPAAQTCGGCHAEVLAEWAPGLHKRAWSNDNILRMTNNFAKTECRPCHSPEAVLPHDLELEPKRYRPPDFRPVNFEDGVHCLSCHGIKGNDGVAAIRDVPGAPCRPVKDERISSVAFCATCHDPTHQAAEEYWTTSQAKDGTTCHDCHMADVKRASGREGRSHVFPGGFDRAQVTEGLHATSALEGREVVVTLANFAAHKFPGEIPSRSLTVFIEAHDAKGERVLDKHFLFRRSFKNREEKDRPDNRLLPGEERVLRAEVPEGAVKATVKVVFRSLPLQPERHAFVLHRGAFELSK